MVSMDTEEPFDETKIVANKTTKDVLDTLANDETLMEIRKEIQGFPFLHGSTTFYCTVTLGISLYDKEQSFKMNMTHADMALYRGKKTGKNRTIWYGYEEESGV